MRKKEEFWKKHIVAWKKSGLSRNAYCVKNGIYQSTMGNWIKKLEQPIKPIKLDPVVTEDSVSEILIEAPGLRVNIPQTVKPEIISTIIRELKICS